MKNFVATLEIETVITEKDNYRHKTSMLFTTQKKALDCFNYDSKYEHLIMELIGEANGNHYMATGYDKNENWVCATIYNQEIY